MPRAVSLNTLTEEEMSESSGMEPQAEQNAAIESLQAGPDPTSNSSSSLTMVESGQISSSGQSVDDEVVEIYLQQAEAYSAENQLSKACQACQEALNVNPNAAEAYKLMGNILQNHGQRTDAMGAYAKALRLRPNFPEVYSNLGSICAYKQQWDLAISYFQKAIEKDGSFATPYINLARVWKKLNNTEKEIETLAIALKLDPQLGAAKDHYRVGRFLEAADKPADDGSGNVGASQSGSDTEAAIQAYRQAVERDPQFVEGYQRLADLLEDQGDWQEAVVCYRKVLDLQNKQATVQSRPDQNQLSQKQANQKQPGPNQPKPALTGTAAHKPPLLIGKNQLPLNISPRDQQLLQKLIQASDQKTRLLQQQSRQSEGSSKGSRGPLAAEKLGLPASSSSGRMPLTAQTNAASPSFTPNSKSPNPVQPQNAQAATQKANKFKGLLQTIGRYQLAIQNAPNSAKLYRGLSQALAESNQRQAAADVMYQAFALEPDWPTAKQCVELGQLLAEGSRGDAAVNCYKQAIRRDPNLLVAYGPLAKLLQQQNQANAAKAVLSELATRQAKAKPKDQAKDQIRRQAGSQTRDQIRDQTGAKKKAQLSVRILKGQKKVKQVKSQPTTAKRKSVAVVPVTAQPTQAQIEAETSRSEALALHKRGEALREEGKWREAIAAYQQSVQLNPQFSWAYHSLGDSYKKLSQWREAGEAYQRAIALKPDFVWSYYSLAEVLEQLEQWDAAAENYRQVLALEPGNEQTPPKLAGVLQNLLQQAPRNVDHYRELARQHLSEGKEKEAIAAYQMVLQIQPGHSEVALALSELLTQQNPQQAQVLLDRACAGPAPEVESIEELSNVSTVAEVLQHTHLFDPIYYRATNPNLAGSDDKTLLLHYIEQGSAAGRQPNPLFDDEFYRNQRPDVVEKNVNPLAHYHCFGYKDGCDPHPFFSLDFYRETHPDVAITDVDPLEHYLSCGITQGRIAFNASQFSHLLTNGTPLDADYLKAWQGVGLEAKGKQKKAEQTIPAQTIGVYCSSEGNYFITEIADFIADALTQAGNTVSRLSEKDTPPDDLDGHWVVAPHEFFYIGEGVHWTRKQNWLAEAIMVNVEQPQTTWFSKAFYFLRHTKAIFDINVKSAAILQTLGLSAYWMPFGYLPRYKPFAVDDAMPELLAVRSLEPEVIQELPDLDAPLEDRPIDVHFVGTLNPRREAFFARSAEWLNQYRCFLHIPPMGVPLLKGQDQALDTETVIGLSRRSKILLNIHRDDLPYFEWHRIIFHGLWQNTLVVTEPCHDIPGLTAGEHFVSCPLKDMPDTIEWLLNDPAGQTAAERIRQAGHLALKERFSGSSVMNRALKLIAEQGE